MVLTGFPFSRVGSNFPNFLPIIKVIFRPEQPINGVKVGEVGTLPGVTPVSSGVFPLILGLVSNSYLKVLRDRGFITWNHIHFDPFPLYTLAGEV